MSPSITLAGASAPSSATPAIESAETAQPGVNSRLGQMIRRIRRQQSRTQDDIAKVCGFTKSLLSRIETGDVNPPVATLVKIAGALNVTLAALLETDDGIGTILTAAEEVKSSVKATELGYETFAFAANRGAKRIQPVFFQIKKGTLRRHSVTHQGEEFLYVLNGSICFHVGNVRYTLHAGDSLYFDASEEHGVEALTEEATYLDIFC